MKKTLLTSQASKEMAHNKKIPKLEKITNIKDIDLDVCPHDEYCKVKYLSKINCMDYEKCQVYKYYEHYKNNKGLK